jgi:hypothetical protein
MARRVWVLDTGTKGTGANMVPLEDTRAKPAASGDLPYVPPKRTPRPQPAPEPRAPRRFKVVDLVSGAVLAEDTDVRTTLDVLDGVDSVVDVGVYIWQPKAESWRLLTLGEQRALYGFRRARPAPVPEDPRPSGA